jgi:hypothetical protein
MRAHPPEAGDITRKSLSCACSDFLGCAIKFALVMDALIIPWDSD